MKDEQKKTEQELTPPSEGLLNPFSDGLAVGAEQTSIASSEATTEAKLGERNWNNTGALWHNRDYPAKSKSAFVGKITVEGKEYKLEAKDVHSDKPRSPALRLFVITHDF